MNIIIATLRAIILIAILLTPSTGGAASAGATTDTVGPPSPVVVDAAHAACSRYAAYDHDYLRHEPGDGPLPPVPTGKEPYRPSDRDMLDLYNSYNVRRAGEILGRYADSLDKPKGTVRRYSQEQCRVLVPAYAMAKTVLVLDVRPLDVSFHGLIDRCRDDGVIHLCFRRSLVSIPARCGLPASASRYVDWCRTPDVRDPLASELERLRSSAKHESGHSSSLQPVDPDTGEF